MATGGVGFITGLNISTVVSDLMTVAEQPVTAVQTQNTTLENEQTAYETLMSDLLGVQNAAKSLQQATLYTSRAATSSDTSALTATVTGTPALGTYTYTPLQVALAQQLLSSGLPSESTSLGTGTSPSASGRTSTRALAWIRSTAATASSPERSKSPTAAAPLPPSICPPRKPSVTCSTTSTTTARPT